MAWSTRQLADLADTTMRAVRHYHDVGLLEEPRRRANGYKQYGVAHLVRVLRIKRLADLGFTLPQIAELGDADRHPREALRTLDSHLAQDLDRLQRARVEVRQILRHSAPTDLPPALAARIRDADLSAADRALLIVLTRVLDLAVVIDFVDTLRDLPPSPAATAFDQLPANADEATRHALATRLLPRSRTLRVMLPRLQSATTGLSVAAARTLDEAVRDLYNPAQSDVLRRVGLLLRSRPDPVRTPRVGVTSARDRVTAATPRVLTAPQRHGVHSSVITAVPVEHPPKALEQRRINRRSVLTATRGAALTGCGIAATPTISPAPASGPPPSAAPPDDPDLAALEGRSGGRLGVHALDTGSGATVSHRGGERFLMASTATLPLAAAVLDRATAEPVLLDRLVRYRPEALLEYAPVTTQNVATGMTVADLCDAALTVSDNSAANLLLELLGGPSAVTAFVHGIGDATTPFDRTEPAARMARREHDRRRHHPRRGPGRGGRSTTRPGRARRASATTSGSSCPRTAHRCSSPSTPTRRPGLDGRQRHHRRGDRIAVRRLVGQ